MEDRRVKVLVVSLFLPGARARHAGGRYVFEVIRHLSARHEVHLATRHEVGEEPGLDELKEFCRRIYPFPYRSPGTRTARDLARLAMSYLSFSGQADRLLRDGAFDLVLTEWVEAAVRIRRRQVPMVLDAHDVITKPAERLYRESKGLRRFPRGVAYLLTRTLERRISRRHDVVITRSDFDRDYLLSVDPALAVKVVPHPAGLDISGTVYEKRRGSILFLASFRHRKVNVEAALYFHRCILPRVRDKVPAARFVVAGYGPPPELVSLRERDPSVEILGYVPDLDRCYKEAEVFVAPILTGGGIIVKVLDALAAGTPVVTTPYGNEGIGGVHDRDLLVVEGPERFADAVATVLRDPALARRLSESGREFVRSRYGLAAVMERLDDALAESAPGGRSRNAYQS